jgi:hypothetical protein
MRLVLEIDENLPILDACRELWKIKNCLRNGYLISYELAMIHKEIYLSIKDMQESLESLVERYHAQAVDIERGKI